MVGDGIKRKKTLLFRLATLLKAGPWRKVRHRRNGSRKHATTERLSSSRLHTGEWR